MYSVILPLILFSLVALACCQTYYIVDSKHSRSIVAGDRYDERIYHQDPSDRLNVKSILEPVRGEPGFFFITNTKFWRRIVSGNNYDGRLYHQAGGNSMHHLKALRNYIIRRIIAF